MYLALYASEEPLGWPDAAPTCTAQSITPRAIYRDANQAPKSNANHQSENNLYRMIGREVEGNEDIRRGDRQEYGEKDK